MENKIIVIGCPGSGKTTFSRGLEEKTGYPLFHLDAIWHKADRTHISREEFDLTEAVEGVCASDEESAARWFSYGNKIVIIKHGKEGSVAYLDDGSAYKVKPFPVKMLKGFGGGDGYASAFIYSLLNGKSVPDALEFATASASMLVSAHSCSAAMPSAEAVQEFIDKIKPTSGEVIEKIK